MRFAASVTMAVGALTAAGLLYAQSSPASAPAAGSAASARKEAKAKPAILVTPEREAAVLTFVQRNHAELAELLAALKTNEPEQYERAIRDIFRTTERLAQIQERDPLQYELEIVAWTAQSRVELLAARLKMGANDELIKQLRDALKTQNEARVALLRHERQKAADRLGKLDAEIARFETDRDDVVNRQLKVLARSGGEGRPAKAAAKLPTKQKKNLPTTP
jgi:alanyl-tRNA synthetase